MPACRSWDRWGGEKEGGHVGARKKSRPPTQEAGRRRGSAGASTVLCRVVVLLLLCMVGGATGQTPLQALYDPSSRADNATDFRNDWCELEVAVRRGDVALRDALKGKELTLTLEPFSFWVKATPEGGMGGHIPSVLDEVASRAGFTWRNSYVLVQGPLQGESYTDFAKYHLNYFDLVADWFTDTPGRRANGLSFAYNWIDLSLILVTRPEKQSADFGSTFFSFLKPFEFKLWVVLVVAVLYSAFVFWFLEHNVNDNYKFRSAIDGMEAATYAAACKITWSGHFAPMSTSGRLFAISWAIVCVCFFSSYTARLASSLVTSVDLNSPITSPEQANTSKSKVCVLAGTAVVSVLKAKYPMIPQVASKTTAEMFQRVRSRQCVGAVVDTFSWSILQVSQEINSDCSFKYLGRPFRTGAGGFVSKADFNGVCSGLMNTVLALHMSEMDDQGFFEDLWNSRIDKETTVDCSSEDASSVDARQAPVQLGTMGGLFMSHVIMSLLCLTYAYFRRRETLTIPQSFTEIFRRPSDDDSASDDGFNPSSLKNLSGADGVGLEYFSDCVSQMMEKQQSLIAQQMHLGDAVLVALRKEKDKGSRQGRGARDSIEREAIEASSSTKNFAGIRETSSNSHHNSGLNFVHLAETGSAAPSIPLSDAVVPGVGLGMFEPSPSFKSSFKTDRTSRNKAKMKRKNSAEQAIKDLEVAAQMC